MSRHLTPPLACLLVLVLLGSSLAAAPASLTHFPATSRTVLPSSPALPAYPLRSAYPVTFLEYGLPSGTNWTATLNGTSSTSSSVSITYNMPNGSYLFSIPSVIGYSPTPSGGNVLVAGAAFEVPVHFVAALVGNTLSLYNNTLMPGNATAQSGIQPISDAFDPAHGTLFVDDYASDNVAEVDVGTGAVVGYTPLSGTPCGITYDNRSDSLYVSVMSRGTVAVLNGTTGTVSTYLKVGNSPCSIAYDPVNGDVYVADTASNNIAVVDAATGSIATYIPFNASKALTFDPQTGQVFAIASSPSTLAEINGTTQVITTAVAAPSGAAAVVYDPNDHDLYVASSSLDLVRVFNAATLATVGNVSVGSTPLSVVYDPVGSGVYCANSGSGNVSRLNGVRLNGTIPVGKDPGGTAVDPATGVVYVSDRGSNLVTKVSPTSNRSTGEILTGLSPDASAYDPADGDLLVAYASADTLALISSTTWKQVGSVPVGSAPDAVLYATGQGKVIVANADSDNLTILNATTLTRIATVPVGSAPSSLAYDPATSIVFVTNSLSGNVSEVNAGTDALVGSLATGGSPYPAFFDPATGNLYVGGITASTLTVFDPSSGRATANLTVGSDPSAVTMDPTTGYLYVANFASNSVSVVNGTDNADVTSIAVGSSPASATYVPGTGGVYVTDLSSNDLSVISTRTLALQGTLPLNNAAPAAITSLPSSHALAVVDELSGAISFALTVALPSVFSVTFTESGLPSGTSWSVDVEGTSLSSSSTVIRFLLENGTYYYQVNGVAGFIDTPTSGDLQVQGTVQSIAVTFTKIIPEYTVTFTENGLPPGTNWSVVLNGTQQNTTTSVLSFSMPAGTYSYAIESAVGYGPSPRTGTLSVQTTNVNVNVAYRLPEYNVTFVANGKPAGIVWWVSLSGHREQGNASTLSFTGSEAETNGSYGFTVSPVPGYLLSEYAGTVTVRGTPAPVTVTFTPTVYMVVFTESGLHAGTNWSVTLNGVTHYGISSPISFELPNGTYNYSVGRESGFNRLPTGGLVTVNGGGQSLHVSFLKPPASGIAALLSSPVFYATLGAGIAVVAIFTYYMLRRKPRTESEEEGGDSGEAASPEEDTPEGSPAPQELSSPPERKALPEKSPPED